MTANLDTEGVVFKIFLLFTLLKSRGHVGADGDILYWEPRRKQTLPALLPPGRPVAIIDDPYYSHVF